MPRAFLGRIVLIVGGFGLAWAPGLVSGGASEPHRSPIALAVAPDGTRVLTANQTSDSVSLVDISAGRVLAETTTGRKPAGVAWSPDGKRAVVSHWYGYDVAILEVSEESLKVLGRVEVGPEPRGVALSSDGATAYVAVGVTNEVVRLDLASRTVTGRLTVGREPRGLALSPDGARLLVGNARSSDLSLIDTAAWRVERTLPIDGLNLRQVAIGLDGFGYVANMKNRGFATTRNNIDQGWVLGQRVSRVNLDGGEPYETLTLDPHGEAVGDVHGLAFSSDGSRLALSAGGTREVLLLRTDLKRLPWRVNGSRDLIDPALYQDKARFRRVPVDGRPTEIAFGPDGRSLIVANYLLDAVQVVDAAAGRLVQTIALGGPKELTAERRGEWLFHDATRSLNQWYSCNTCHSDGHTNGGNYDTMNDGWQDLSVLHKRSRKKVPTLRRVAETGPWTWHGWQAGLGEATIESFTKSMQGKRPTDAEVSDLVAFLGTLDYPRNPFREPDGSLSASAQRGEVVFKSAKAGCVSCHGGPEFTDGKIHDVGLNERGDVYKGHNPPSLRGAYDKGPYLHDGRAETLKDVLTGDHSPEVFSSGEALSPEELDDLIAYLRAL